MRFFVSACLLANFMFVTISTSLDTTLLNTSPSLKDTHQITTVIPPPDENNVDSNRSSNNNNNADQIHNNNTELKNQIIYTLNKVVPKGYWDHESLARLADIYIDYAIEHSKLDPVNLIALAMHESNWYPRARGRNRNGTDDRGIYQHNSRWWTPRYNASRLYIRDHVNIEHLLPLMVNDRYNPETSLIVTIHNLAYMRSVYRLTGINIYFAHFGHLYARGLRSTRASRAYKHQLSLKIARVKSIWNTYGNVVL